MAQRQMLVLPFWKEAGKAFPWKAAVSCEASRAVPWMALRAQSWKASSAKAVPPKAASWEHGWEYALATKSDGLILPHLDPQARWRLRRCLHLGPRQKSIQTPPLPMPLSGKSRLTPWSVGWGRRIYGWHPCWSHKSHFFVEACIDDRARQKERDARLDQESEMPTRCGWRVSKRLSKIRCSHVLSLESMATHNRVKSTMSKHVKRCAAERGQIIILNMCSEKPPAVRNKSNK